jgi:hypothetical protein
MFTSLLSYVWVPVFVLFRSLIYLILHNVDVCRLYDVFMGARIAQSYSAGLRAGCSGVRVPAGAGNFSLHHRVQTGPGAHPASYPTGTRGSFPGSRASGVWSWPLTSI